MHEIKISLKYNTIWNISSGNLNNDRRFSENYVLFKFQAFRTPLLFEPWWNNGNGFYSNTKTMLIFFF